jgi:hypothetical protein
MADETLEKEHRFQLNSRAVSDFACPPTSAPNERHQLLPFTRSSPADICGAALIEHEKSPG